MKQETSPSRQNTITDVEVIEINPEGSVHSRQSEIRNWMVIVHWKSGLAQEACQIMYFENEDEAKQAALVFRAGSSPPLAWSRNRLEYLGSGQELTITSWRILIEAGLFLPNDQATKWPDGNIAKEVCECLGVDRLNELRNEFDKHWKIAALLEYCLANFPNTSPAQIAAECLYQFNIEGDQFASGYLLRDLEYALANVETDAGKYRSNTKARTDASGDKSHAVKMQRVESLLRMMESLPKVVLNADMSPLDLAYKFALPACREADPALWNGKFVKKTIDRYLDEMRGGRSGDDLYDRYYALFAKKTHKRFP